jgi:hypothetical protein
VLTFHLDQSLVRSFFEVIGGSWSGEKVLWRWNTLCKVTNDQSINTAVLSKVRGHWGMEEQDCEAADSGKIVRRRRNHDLGGDERGSTYRWTTERWTGIEFPDHGVMRTGSRT